MSQIRLSAEAGGSRGRRHRGWMALDAVLATSRPDLEPALRAAGIATLPGDSTRDLPGSGLLVLGGGHPEDVERALASAETSRLGGQQWAIALVVEGLSEAHAHWASRLTPFVYPAALSSGALAGFLCAALRRSGYEGDARARARSVTLRPGEMEMEIDGVPARLGIAERNFLMTLAEGTRAWLAKHAPVAVGAGHAVEASECRRRLGRRIGPELASLLVPDERGQPYRLRGRVEVERACALRPDLHPMTCLRIFGRGSIHASAHPDLDHLPD